MEVIWPSRILCTSPLNGRVDVLGGWEVTPCFEKVGHATFPWSSLCLLPRFALRKIESWEGTRVLIESDTPGFPDLWSAAEVTEFLSFAGVKAETVAPFLGSMLVSIFTQDSFPRLQHPSKYQFFTLSPPPPAFRGWVVRTSSPKQLRKLLNHSYPMVFRRYGGEGGTHMTSKTTYVAYCFISLEEEIFCSVLTLTDDIRYDIMWYHYMV